MQEVLEHQDQTRGNVTAYSLGKLLIHRRFNIRTAHFHCHCPFFLAHSHSFASRGYIPFLATMVAQNFYSSHASRSPYLQPNPSTTEEDFKASYDDLVDEHAEPYSATARHQTFTVGTPGQTHHRGASIPLSSKSAYTSNPSDDTHETCGYPPTVPLKDVKELDTRTLWQKVRILLPSFVFPNIVVRLGSARISSMSILRRYSAHRNDNRPCN